MAPNPMYPMRIYLLLTAAADPVLGGLPHHKATLRYRAPGGDRRRVAFSRGAGKWLLPQLKATSSRPRLLAAIGPRFQEIEAELESLRAMTDRPATFGITWQWRRAAGV